MPRRLSYRLLLRLCSVTLLAVFASFALRTVLLARQALHEDEARYLSHLITATDVANGGLATRTLTLATMLAADPEVGSALARARELYLAHERDGLDPHLIPIRDALQQHLQPQWDQLNTLYGVNAIQFHLYPDGHSFLRMHAPRLYGDAAGATRPLVARALSTFEPVSGFETGLAHSGMRGVVPIFIRDGGLKILIGSVEVGIDHRQTLSQLGTDLKATFALVTHPPSAIAGLPQLLAAYPGTPDGDRILATSQPDSLPLIRQHRFPPLRATTQSDLMNLEGRTYQLIQLALTTRNGEFPFGRMLVLRDVSSLQVTLHAERNQVLLWAAGSYLLLQLLLVILMRQAQRQWQAQVDQQAHLLVQKEERLRTLIEALPDPVIFLDPGNRIIEINASARAAFGNGQGEIVAGDTFTLPAQLLDRAHQAGGRLRTDLEYHATDLPSQVFDVITRPASGAAGKGDALVLIARNVTEARRSSAEIERLSHLHEQVLMAAGDGIFGVDPQGRITFINPAALHMLGYRREAVIGRNHHSAFHHHAQDGNPYPPENCPVVRTLRDGQARQQDEWLVRADGSLLPVRLAVAPMQQGSPLNGTVVVFQDITESQQREQRLHHLASTDPLTGLENRRRFLGRLETLLHQAGERREISLLMLDLDHFKQVNDRYGHNAGDQVLRAFAGSIRQHLRKADEAGRLGGEEFAVLLPETRLEDARELAERLRRSVTAMQVPYDGQFITITVSIGVTTLDAGDQRPEDALARADAALYRAKESGRNQVAVTSAA